MTGLSVALLSTSAAHADGCPQAEAARRDGRPADAETAARACLAADPGDVGTWFELSRAVGFQARYDEALHWAERALERFPADTDLAVWRVRLLAWSGHLAVARAALDDVKRQAPAAFTDPETAMLDVDLVFWGHDWPAATAGYTTYLARWPDDAEALRKRGITHLRQDAGAHAIADLERACALGSALGCDAVDGARRDAASVAVSVEPTYIHSSVGDDVNTRLVALARLGAGLELGLGGELRTRFAADGTLTDALAWALASWHNADFACEAGLGVGPGATFSPRLSAWVEPALALTASLWARLRYWRVSFADGGAHVLSPSLDLYLGAFEIDLRYFLAFEDGAAAPKHAGVARVRWDVGHGLGLELGGGGGDATDSFDQPNLAMSHALVLGGVSWEPAWNHRLGFTAVFRRESQGDAWAARYELGLSYRLLL